MKATLNSIARLPGSLIVLNALFLLLLSGCGYHIAGKGGKFPGGIVSIAVPFFTNQTSKPEIESILTLSFADELVKTGLVKVVNQGDGILKGTIKRYRVTSISFDQRDIVKKYRLTVVIDLVLVRSSNGEVLWEGKGFKDSEEFLTPDVATSDTNEDEALKKIAADLAKLFKERILEGF